MDQTLKQDQHQIQDILRKTVEVAMSYYRQQHELPPSYEIGDLPHLSLPEQGLGAENVLNIFQNEYSRQMANSAGPRYFGFVTGGSTPASVAGDWLVSVYDQVMSGKDDSIAHSLERQTINLLRQFFGLDDSFTGTFVTGATMSNFVSLATARQWVAEESGVDASEDGIDNVPIRILSATPHSSILKSMSMLGIGRKAWAPVDTQPQREAIDLVDLEKKLSSLGKPCIVVANAGTVNTADFDDLEGIARLKSRYRFWFHIDAAFGGFAAVSPQFEHLVKGLALADTVTVDAHKWMNVPYDAAMQFTKHRQLQTKVFQNSAAYLGQPGDIPASMHLTPENSRRFRALPAWFSIMAYGKNGYRDIIERNCSAARQFGELINNSENFELLAPVKLNVVCFTIKKDKLSMNDIKALLDNVRDDGRVFFTQTVYKGIPAIRAAISNWQTSPDDVALGFKVIDHIRLKTFSEEVPVR